MNGSAFCDCRDTSVTAVGRGVAYNGRRRLRRQYLEVFVGRFLPFLGHCLWGRLREQANDTEEGDTDADAGGDDAKDLPALARGVLSTGTVRSESNPIGCGDGARVSKLRW